MKIRLILIIPFFFIGWFFLNLYTGSMAFIRAGTTKDLNEAKILVDISLDYQPRHYRAKYLNGLLLTKSGSWDLAASELEELNEWVPDYQDVNLLLSWCYFNMGHYDLAEIYLESHNKIFPNFKGYKEGLRMLSEAHRRP